MLCCHDEGLGMGTSAKAEAALAELVQVGDLVQTISSKPLVVCRHTLAWNHHIGFKVLLVVDEVGVHSMGMLTEIPGIGTLDFAYSEPTIEVSGAVAAREVADVKSLDLPACSGVSKLNTMER